jgi:hypothetical protein
VSERGGSSGTETSEAAQSSAGESPPVGGAVGREIDSQSDPANLDSLPVCPARATAPTPLPGVRPEHLTLDYWLGQQDPELLDEVVLSAEDIGNHNRAILTHQDERPLGLYDLLGPIDVDELQRSIDERLVWLLGQFREGRYLERDGEPLSEQALSSFQRVELPSRLSPQFRVARDLVPIRCGPRLEGYFTPALDLRFDRNNCSSARSGEVVQVLHEWPSGLLLARTSYTIGWIDPRAALSPPLSRAEAEALLNARVARPLTRRAFLEAAFSYLDTPYGWGGEGGGRDCSRFVQDVLESFGLQMPRHSAYQAAAGTFSIDVSGMTSETERQLIIDAAQRAGIVLLHFPGHIMVYLGRDEAGTPMAIHSFAEYLEPCPDGTRPEGEAPETLFTVDTVSVSDLELGRGTSRTAFIERLTRVVVLGQRAGVELAGIAEMRPAAPLLAAPEGRACHDSNEVAFYVSPEYPNRQQPLRVIATAEQDLGPVELTLVDPRDRHIVPEVRELGGPPYGFVSQIIESPRGGNWRAVLGDGSRIESCYRFRVHGDWQLTRTAPEFLAARAADAEAAARLAAEATEGSRARAPGAEGPAAAPGPEATGGSRDGGEGAPQAGEDLPGEDEPTLDLGPVWEVRRAWTPARENLYATWVESLFDYSHDEDMTWTSLHELTLDRERNFLFNHLGQGEDERLDEEGEEYVLQLTPDCADLPYLLRAYFAWKMGMPFGFRLCGRGTAGEPPRCGEVTHNLSPRVAEDDVEAFAWFANREVRSTVHSSTGRTHPEYNFSDFYPVALSRETVRPGTVFDDPYGHVLVIADWVPQGRDGYGVLLGADAQPDGTVGRRRFWRGSFLFTPDTHDVGAGFKYYRPLLYGSGEEFAEPGPTIRAMTNEELLETTRFPRLSLEQYQGSADDFYEKMEALINPRPLDPIATQVSLVDGLEEAVIRRLNSVDNGEAYMREQRYATMEMPEGYAIFQTIGPWEDYSTPSRDMRLLISIDTVVGFPDVVRRSPQRFGLREDGLDEGVAEIERRLEQELAARTFIYTRSDGSSWQLRLSDVVARQVGFEMAYNPNDCVEIRWAAPEGSEEYATCQRHAPDAQHQRMLSYRSWFADRQRPPR